jgi:hypothetical protein
MEGYSQYEKGNHQDAGGGPKKERRCVTGQSSDYVATDPRKEGVEGWKGL